MNGNNSSGMEHKLNLKPWDKEADTKMLKMLGGISSIGIDAANLSGMGLIVSPKKTEALKDEDANTFREHMAHRNQMLAMINTRQEFGSNPPRLAVPLVTNAPTKS